MHEQLNNWQKKPYKEVISKRRKKNIQQPTQASLARSQITKQRNRYNAQLDRYKRRLLCQYLKCLPYLIYMQRQIQNKLKVQLQPKEQNQHNQKIQLHSSVSDALLKDKVQQSKIPQEQKHMAIREKAMKIAIQKFLKFHDLHIMEKNENDQKFTLQSIRPQIRKQFMNFIKKLLSYSNEQLFEIDQKNLLDHSLPNFQKNRLKQKQVKNNLMQKEQKQKIIQNNQAQDLLTKIQTKYNTFPLIIIPNQNEDNQRTKPILNIFNKKL